MACVYFVAQMLGAFMGYGLLMIMTPADLIFPSEGPGLCVTMPHSNLTAFQALAFEYIATTVLIMICGGVWDPRNAKHQDSIPLRFGFAIMAIGLIVGPFTGASMNPARSFGPALWNHDFTMHWVSCEIVFIQIFLSFICKIENINEKVRKSTNNFLFL